MEQIHGEGSGIVDGRLRLVAFSCNCCITRHGTHARDCLWVYGIQRFSTVDVCTVPFVLPYFIYPH